ncbi:diguanylate cyclase [Herbaspirillum hiltneri N3]|uniref:Diguanylate cyclase n=2 Tax=Herbaspirillum TaxID=963 RepID=A0ABN4I6W8_9BURK|nr:diguanylate cyclase [Herbaspirillum hiltneri N3]
MTHVASEKKLAVESASSESHNMAAIMAANLNDRLSRAGQYAAVGSKVLDGDASAAEYLGLLFNGDSAYVRAAVFDAQMRLRYSSAGLPEESEFARLLERAYPQAAAGAEAPEAGTILFGKTDSHNWRMPMLIALQAPKSGARGYLVAILDLGRFLHDYQQIGDGYLIAVNGGTGAPLVALNDRRLLVGDNSAAFTSASSVTNLQKLSAYPLSVSVTIDPDAIVSDLTRSHYEYVRYAIVISIAVVTLTLILIGISYHRKKLYERLARSEREKICLIEQLEKEKTRAYQLASHDYLTGIPNRMLFSELAGAELSRAKRSPNLYALFFIDLDGFKPINDTLGHAVGDLLLKAVAQRLCASLREYDLVARLGGDEFVVLLSDIKYQSQIADIADKLIKTVGAPYLNLGGHEVGTSLSIGIALYPDDGHTVDELLSKADAAMYAAKKAGKGAYRFHDSSVHSGLPGRLPSTVTRYLSA